MDLVQLKQIIENSNENECIDYKLKMYHFSQKQNKEEFLKDILALANSKENKEKYLIFGVKEENYIRKIEGIDKSSVKDQAIYQQLVRENIEPDINLEIEFHEINQKNICVFIIRALDKPYILKKDYGKYEKGTCFIRINTTTTRMLRKDFDEIYKQKLNTLSIENKNISSYRKEYKNELLLGESLKKYYSYIMNKEDEIKYYIDEIKFEIENIKKYIRYEQRISIGDEFYNAMQEILKMHDEIYNLNFLNDLLKECACDFYEEYTKIILFVSQKYTDFNNYINILKQISFPQQRIITKGQFEQFYTIFNQIYSKFPEQKYSSLIWGDSTKWPQYYSFLDKRIQTLQKQLQKENI